MRNSNDTHNARSSQPTMRAAVYDSFHGPISIRHVPRPTIPHEDGVILRVMAAGVCRSDWHGWRGHDDDIRSHGLPFIPGHEFSGLVVAKGSQVQKFHVGDRVAIPFILSCGKCRECCPRPLRQDKKNVLLDKESQKKASPARRPRPTVCENQVQPGFHTYGCMAQYVSLPRADINLCKLPPTVSFVQAASLGCRFTTAYRAVVQRGRLQAGESVVIFGCGGLGLSCVMLAQACGADKIVVVDVSIEALEKAKQLGATHMVRAFTSGDDAQEAVRKQVFEFTHGVGADVSLDASGFTSASENAIWCTRRGGRMVQVGLPLGDKPPQVPLGRAVGWELNIMGSHGFDARDLPFMLRLVADGKLDPLRLVEREVTLEEGIQALEDMDKGSPLGMTVVTQFEEKRVGSSKRSKL